MSNEAIDEVISAEEMPFVWSLAAGYLARTREAVTTPNSATGGWAENAQGALEKAARAYIALRRALPQGVTVGSTKMATQGDGSLRVQVKPTR